MIPLKFYVPDRPKSKARPRARIAYRKGLQALGPKLIAAAGKGPKALQVLVRAHVYIAVHSDPKSVAYERKIAAAAWIAEAARRRAGGVKFRGPVSVDVEIALPRPKRLGIGPPCSIDRAVKPDANNVASAVLDALQLDYRGGKDGEGIIPDDAWNSALFVLKFYAGSDGGPGVLVTVKHALPPVPDVLAITEASNTSRAF